MSGYFKISTEAAKAIVGESDGPYALAGYITLCGYAFGGNRGITAAGAKSIRQTIGCTDFRSKKILDELRAIRFGDRGGRGLITATKRTVGPAKVHAIEEWPGAYAYMPSLLLDRSVNGNTPLSRLLESDDYDSGTLRDALLLFVHVYASTDYAGWFGCPIDLMAYQQWRTDGSAGSLDFELGYQGEVDSLSLWLIAAPDEPEWTAPKRVMTALFGPDEQYAGERFWKALWCLMRAELMVKVLTIQTKSSNHPLWIFSPGYRDSLEKEFGPVGDLARYTQRCANRTDLDPDNYIIQEAVGAYESQGTGLFFCVGGSPQPYLVLAPRLHAPTPINLDGITEVAETVKRLKRDIRLATKTEQGNRA